MSLFGGFSLKSSVATFAKVAIQPAAPAPAVKFATNAKLLPQNSFTAVAATSKPSIFTFAKFDFRLISSVLRLNVDTRFKDELPRSVSKFTPFEEISGIASTRPEILSVSEFKPIFSNSGYKFTPAGEFMDAQVKLMNIRHEAMAQLINDLKKDSDIAEQLDQIEGDFLKHLTNVRSRVDFLVGIQRYTENIVKLFDLRAPESIVDPSSLLSHFFNAAFSNLNVAQAAFAGSYTYTDLLGQHGFNKNNVNTFSNTKVFLQTLNEARKMLRAGSDELVGVDPSLAGRDADPVTLNKRSYRDPHVALEHVSMLTYDDIKTRSVYESDTRLTNLLSLLETKFKSIDNVFAGATSEEVSYALKLRTLTREVAYSHAISNTSTVALLGEYGYPIRTDVGNQQLFDAVYGQLGNRITDDRSSVNANSVSSIASRIDGDKAILTYEVDYLDDEQGSVFTPGATYYVTSAVRPNETGAFSIERSASLVRRLANVVERYVNFVTRFNLLPRASNVALNQLANANFVFDPVVMTNSLYDIFVDKSTGFLKNDVSDNPIVDFMGEAATNASLRANLLMYVSMITDASGDGLANAEEARSLAGQDLRAEAQKRAADAENQNARVSPTIDKIVKNCVSLYKSFTGDTVGSTKIDKALRNFNEQGPLARAIAFVKASHDVYKTIISAGYTRYSHLSDVQMIALTLQAVLDSARRYAYTRTRVNTSLRVTSNFKVSSALGRAPVTVQQATPQLAVKALGKTKVAVSAFSAPKQSFVMSVPYFISKLPLKQAVVARLEREELLALRTVMSPLYAMYPVGDKLRDFVLYLQKPENTQVLNEILNVVGDRKLVELLADKGQVRLLLDTVVNIQNKLTPKASYNKANTDLTDVVSLTRNGLPDDDLKVFDDSFVTSKTANILKAVFATSKFSPDRGSNIRLIALGFPHGFSTQLENKFKISTFAEQARSKRKQNDVVVVDVYKVDVRYPDLVFKPIPKVLELSRFAVRDESAFTPVGVGASLNTALDCIPTQDYTSLNQITLTRASDKQNLLQGEYEFMTSQDVSSMLNNTVMSYLLELYYRLLTGIPLNERELFVADPNENDKPAPYITQAILENTIKFELKQPVKKGFAFEVSQFVETSTLRSSISTKSNVVKNLKSSKPMVIKHLGRLPKRTQAAIQSTAVVANQAAQKKTVYVDKEIAAKQMMSPKLFERIFFVDVDPDDFEIDREETFKSGAGKSTFSQMNQAGEIVIKSENVGGQTRNSYFLRDHKQEKQMTFEKYFVVVRSYTPLTTRTS